MKAGAATLSVKLDPTQWADVQEVPAPADAEHLDYFAHAVARKIPIGAASAFSHEGERALRHCALRLELVSRDRKLAHARTP